MVSPHNSPFTFTLPAALFSFNCPPTPDCSGCNCWLGPLPSFFFLLFCCCFPSSPSPSLPYVLLWAHRAQVFLPCPERKHAATYLFSKPQRQQKLNRPWGWHETEPRQGDIKCLNVFLLNLQNLPPTPQKKKKKKKENQTREALVALPVWDWYLIPGTE